MKVLTKRKKPHKAQRPHSKWRHRWGSNFWVYYWRGVCCAPMEMVLLGNKQGYYTRQGKSMWIWGQIISTENPSCEKVGIGVRCKWVCLERGRTLLSYTPNMRRKLLRLANIAKKRMGGGDYAKTWHIQLFT